MLSILSTPEVESIYPTVLNFLGMGQKLVGPNTGCPGILLGKKERHGTSHNVLAISGATSGGATG